MDNRKEKGKAELAFARWYWAIKLAIGGHILLEYFKNISKLYNSPKKQTTNLVRNSTLRKSSLPTHSKEINLKCF